MPQPIRYRRLRAPRRHGEGLIDPPLHEGAQLAQRNQEAAARLYPHVRIADTSLAELAASARGEARRSATAWTLAHADPRFVGQIQSASQADALVVTGHQPELYHPGVWFKSFVLDALARQLPATPLHVLADSDTVAAPAIRVPRDKAPYFDVIPLDDPGREVPWEERGIINTRLFNSFPDRLGHRAALAHALWPQARPHFQLGTALATGTRHVELAHGLRTLHLPLSALCDTPEFARFALHLLLELPRLQPIYNDALREFRDVHRIRSRAHPVPALKREGERREAPLWTWTKEHPERRPLWVSCDSDALAVTDDIGAETWYFPVKNGRVTDETVDAWQTARRSGLKIRPRALITTMYLRLVIGDLFIHGIGGAKYDQLTDAIIERFFDIPPPGYLAATATVRLLPGAVETEELEAQLRSVRHTVRELPYHPERAPQSVATPEFTALAETKRAHLERRPPRGARKAWHDELQAINEALAPFAAHHLGRLTALRESLALELDKQRILGSREYSYCLFDEQLPELLKRLAAGG